MKTAYYMNRENGNIVSWPEMMVEMEELYDGGDPTNALDWDEYYDYFGQLSID